jgi:hypothetical protein
MRPQGFGQVGNGLEDLGWNDMGHEAPKPAEGPRDAFGDENDQAAVYHPTGLTPVQSPVHDQQAELADRLGIDPEDEEFDETAELYDPDAPDAFETEEPQEDYDGEEASVEETPAVEAYEVPRQKVQALPIREADEDEPFELTERFEDFDPFEHADEETAPEAFVPPQSTAAQAYEPAPAIKPAAAYEPIPVSQLTPRAAPGTKAKAAFTLRLDPDRHLKLRLACAVNGRSAQQIVTDAVDQLLRQMPELDAMAEKAKRKG